MLESLYQHRLLTASQINTLHTPTSTLRWTQRTLAHLHAEGLIGRARGQHGQALWFLTPKGAETVEATSSRVEPRRRIPTHAQAAGPLRAHTRAVNDTGIAFVIAARARGDDCGPLSWRHEIAHPISPQRGRRPAEMVIADALLTYLQADQQTLLLHQRFIELDRGTIPPDQLAAKFTRYTRLRHYKPTPAPKDSPDGPLWRTFYRTFPHILVVLAHQPPRAVNKRIQRVLALHNTDPARSEHEPTPISFVTLRDLAHQGPFAPIFITAEHPEQPVDWLGHKAKER